MKLFSNSNWISIWCTQHLRKYFHQSSDVTQTRVKHIDITFFCTIFLRTLLELSRIWSLPNYQRITNCMLTDGLTSNWVRTPHEPAKNFSQTNDDLRTISSLTRHEHNSNYRGTKSTYCMHQVSQNPQLTTYQELTITNSPYTSYFQTVT